jgi:hypothetical protein
VKVLWEKLSRGGGPIAEQKIEKPIAIEMIKASEIPKELLQEEKKLPSKEKPQIDKKKPIDEPKKKNKKK